MTQRSTSTRRRATSPSAGSASPSSTDSSPVTPEIPNLEAAPPNPPGPDAPVSSPETDSAEADHAASLDRFERIATEHPEAVAAHMERMGSAMPILRAGNTHAQLVALVDAVDAYARGAGSWDDVLYQLETAKALLGLTGG